MNLNNINLPYPVLGMADDIIPLPDNPIIEIENDAIDHIFNVSLNTNNPLINKLVKDGIAVYSFEVECRKTFFRHCFTSKKSEFQVKIPRKYVAGEIVITPTVVAKYPILKYENPGFHEDYSGYTFNIEPGDLLCVFQQYFFSAEIEYDKLKAVSSFISILKTDKKISYVDLDKPKINLYLPEDLYNQYRTKICHQNDFNSAIHASLAMNAIVYGILQIEEYKDRKWAQTIKFRVGKEEQFNNLDLETPSDALRIAQLLLGDPYRRMFNSFIDLE